MAAEVYQPPNYDWLNKYVRVPYVKCGRTMAGFDCWGFVVLALAQEHGIYLPSVQSGAVMPFEERKTRAMDVAYDATASGSWEQIYPRYFYQSINEDEINKQDSTPIKFQPFDVLLFVTSMNSLHCGLFIDGHQYAEAVEGRGVVVSDYLRPAFARLQLKVFRSLRLKRLAHE